MLMSACHITSGCPFFCIHINILGQDFLGNPSVHMTQVIRYGVEPNHRKRLGKLDWFGIVTTSGKHLVNRPSTLLGSSMGMFALDPCQ